MSNPDRGTVYHLPEHSKDHKGCNAQVMYSTPATASEAGTSAWSAVSCGRGASHTSNQYNGPHTQCNHEERAVFIARVKNNPSDYTEKTVESVNAILETLAERDKNGFLKEDDRRALKERMDSLR